MPNSQTLSSAFLSRNAKSLGIGALALLAFTVIYLLTPTLVCYWSGHAEMEKRGQFGDQFGAFNAFVSMMTVVAVLGSIWLQREQHKEQMGAAKREHEAQMADAERKHIEEMRETIRARELDRLFRLLDRKVKAESDTVWYLANGGPISGIEATRYAKDLVFAALHGDYPLKSRLAKDCLNLYREDEVNNRPPATLDEFKERYHLLFRISQFRIGEYLRTISSIAKAAARAKREGDEAIVQTSHEWLTQDDLDLLFMHWLGDDTLARDLRELGWMKDAPPYMSWVHLKT